MPKSVRRKGARKSVSVRRRKSAIRIVKSKKTRKSIELTSNGDLIELDELYEGTPFFRKPTTPYSNEHFIYQLLSRKPHPNIVDVYRITDHYIDIELVSPSKNRKTKKMRDMMKKAKTFLQQNNIVYIDWKPDNVGLDENGNYKLYDFDGSGVFNCEGEWVFRAPDYYMMRHAPDGYSPIQIDDWSFDQNM